MSSSARLGTMRVVWMCSVFLPRVLRRFFADPVLEILHGVEADAQLDEMEGMRLI